MRIASLLTITAILSSACLVQGTPGSGDDEAGIPEDPYDQPGWQPASQRLVGQLPYPGYLNPPSELEYAPLAPSVLNKPELGDWASLPPKPWIPGIADVYEEPAKGDPTYWEIPSIGSQPQPTVNPTEATRSGLVGNFGFWAQLDVPETHPRPPIVWMNVLAYIGHPLFAGRYNTYGLPCSSHDNPLQNSLIFQGWDTVGPHADCWRHIVFTGVAPVSFDFPFQNDIAQFNAWLNSATASRCLDNGGEYKAVEVVDGAIVGGAVLSAPSRNGLVWLNWDEVESIQQWINVELGVGELGVLVDELLAGGFNYWPTDPDYRYSRWSTTGECAFEVRLSVAPSTTPIFNCIWKTNRACPKGMVPILPAFDADGMLGACYESGQVSTVGGYCSYPHYEVPPGAAFQPNGDLDIAPYEPNGYGVGIPNSYAVSLSPSSLAALSRAATDIETFETDDGLYLDAMTPNGERSLAQFGLEVDDAVVSLGYGEVCTGRSTRGCSISRPTRAQLEAYVFEQAIAGDMMILDVATRDGWRKRIHVLTTFNPF